VAEYLVRILVPRGTASRVLGVSARTYERLEAAGVVKPHTAGKRGKPASYDLLVVVPAFLRHLQEEKPELPRDARDRTQAELNELKLGRERRQLLPREQVVSEGQAYVAAVTAKLRSIPPRLVQAGAVPVESQAALVAMLEEAVSEMARWSTALELVQAEDDPV
jgi:hypothetical protein